MGGVEGDLVGADAETAMAHHLVAASSTFSVIWVREAQAHEMQCHECARSVPLPTGDVFRYSTLVVTGGPKLPPCWDGLLQQQYLDLILVQRKLSCPRRSLYCFENALQACGEENRKVAKRLGEEYL